MNKFKNLLTKIKNLSWQKILLNQKNAFKQALKELMPCCLK